MHRIISLFMVAILAMVALAAPTAKQVTKQSLSKRSFTIPRIRKTGYLRNPSEAMGRAYRKFGWEMTTPDGTPWAAISKTPTSEAGDDLSSVSSETSGSSSSSSVSDSSSGSVSSPKNYASARVKVASASTTSAAAGSASTGDSNSTGEVVATPADNGAEYLSPVTIGGQKLNLNFDTGSADL